MKPSITIIGAGLVGSLWGILLRKRGHEVSIFERRPDIRHAANTAGRSINLIITSRGLHALKKAGLLEKALEISVAVYGRMIHPKAGDLTYQAYGLNDEHNLSISREALNCFLLDQAESLGVKIHFDQTPQAIDFDQQSIKFSNGAIVPYEKLFGTDGAGSFIRKSLIAHSPGIYTEKSTWLDADYKELSLPSPNPLDPRALHIWPRGSHMMMALANRDGSFTVTLYLPKKGPVSFERVQTEKDVAELFRNEFPDAIPLMPTYKEEFLRNPQGGLGTIRCSKWVYRDSVALMGDAAHAIVPFFGQGMNSGFEDCTRLLEILDETASDWQAAFNKYDETQRPNANAIADMAIENWFEMSEKVADPRFQLRKKAEGVLEKHFPQLFKSRYGMVTYTLTPYSLVQKAGELQDHIFAELLRDVNSVDQLDLEKAKQLLDRDYRPFLAQHDL